MTQMFEAGLGRRDANYVPLTPIDFLVRTAEVYGERLAIVHGDVRRTWGETTRAKQLASALARLGVERGDTVAAMLPNIPAMVEAHFGVPMAGAVLNTINTRLDVSSVLFMLRHGEAKVLIVDTEYAEFAHRAALEVPGLKIVSVADAMPADPARFAGATDYEALVASGDADYAWTPPADEWEAIALNYTSGTTGDPKGVVYHHRGAYLAAVSNLLEWDMPKHAVYQDAADVPLQRLVLPWAVAARAGVNVCLRKFDAKTVFDLIRRERITHYCGAPIVQSAIANAPAEFREGIDHTVHAMVAGGARAGRDREDEGDRLRPAARRADRGLRPGDRLREAVALGGTERRRARAAQRAPGVRYHLEAGATVLDPDTMAPVPADGETLGEIMFRGNICMKGYLKNPKATDDAFHGGWFHTGDLAVLMPDGYIRIKDRKKDIIISGGENISSIEVEDALYRHPAVAVAAVVAMPDPKWARCRVRSSSCAKARA